MRREFRLPQDDEKYLNTIGLPWETIKDGGSNWLLVHAAAVPDGYNVNHMTEAYLIDPNYPDTQIDMVYVHPPLQRRDGKQINNLCDQPLDSRVFQRWSRHRTGANQWRRGVDDISTHRELASYWLRREFALR